MLIVSDAGLGKIVTISLATRDLLLSEIRNFLKHTTKSWLKSRDVRNILGISAGKLQTMRNNNEIPFIKIGSSIFYKEEDVYNLKQH